MSDLKGSKTVQNLKDAFAGESQANRRYLYFAKVAERFFGALRGELVLNSTPSGYAGQAHPIGNELPNNGLSCVVPGICSHG